MNRHRVSGLVLALILSPLAAGWSQEAVLSVDRIFGTRDFANTLVTGLEWTADGQSFTAIEAVESGGTDLVRIDARTGARSVLVRAADLVPPGASRPVEIESYQFSADNSKLLIFTNSVPVWRDNTKGTYYVWDFGARRLRPVSRQPGYQMFAKFSPDARMVGFVRDHNIHVTDLGTGVETALTTDGNEHIINGTTDWVYEEELGLRDAFRWSPDGRRVAFWRLDQSAIKPFHLIDETPLYPTLKSLPYPKAGLENSEVRLGVVDLAARQAGWIDLGAEQDIYIPAMDFAGTPDSIWFTRLNRHQNRLDLLIADVRSGKGRLVMTDTDSAWVETNEPEWLAGGKQFLYLSERDGFAQVFLFNRDGSLARKLTPGNWDVRRLYGADEKAGLVYFSAAAPAPSQTTLHRVGLDGKTVTAISSAPGAHSAQFNPTFTLYVDTYSRAGVPPTQTLHQADGAVVRVLADNKTLIDRVAGLGLKAPEFFRVPVGNGVELEAWIIRPRDFDARRRYPVLMYVYGGPGSQMVTDAWGGTRYLWHQMLAQDGYLVVSVDNRGTGGRGSTFKKATYLNLGQLESADQIAAARWLAAQPWVDPARIGVWGWSYGGYLSSLSLFRGGDAFKAAIAVAPVTDWRFYDTIYTERYLRTPQENAEGYRKGAPLAYADSLRGRFLLVHGTGDDNVHPQNSVHLIQKLTQANKQFDMRFYPNKTHSISGGNTPVNLYGLFTEWLKENL